jgi:hypothetical protein
MIDWADQRRIHEVLADEPDVPLVGPDHLAHQQVVRAVVAISAACRAIARLSFRTISCAWRSREICVGTSSRWRGGRGISVISATS